MKMHYSKLQIQYPITPRNFNNIELTLIYRKAKLIATLKYDLINLLYYKSVAYHNYFNERNEL